MDEQLRELRRRRDLGAAEYAAWVAAHLRAGGRDPRRDPRPGDVVESCWVRARPVTEWSDPVGKSGKSGRLVQTWRPRPGRSERYAVRRIEAPAMRLDEPRAGDGQPHVARVRCYGDPPAHFTGDELPPITLRSWRRWARRGRVLRVADDLDLCGHPVGSWPCTRGRGHGGTHCAEVSGRPSSCGVQDGTTRHGADGEERACACNLDAGHAGPHRYWGLTPFLSPLPAHTGASSRRSS